MIFMIFFTSIGCDNLLFYYPPTIEFNNIDEYNITYYLRGIKGSKDRIQYKMKINFKQPWLDFMFKLLNGVSLLTTYHHIDKSHKKTYNSKLMLFVKIQDLVVLFSLDDIA